MRTHILFIVALLISSCSSDVIQNKNNDQLKFSKISSTYQVTDINNYNCEIIDRHVIAHILETGELVTDREIHDYYFTIGCSINGSAVVSGNSADFTFDYGGIIRFSNGTIIGCGKKCCIEGFTYCSWDKEDLKG